MRTPASDEGQLPPPRPILTCSQAIAIVRAPRIGGSLWPMPTCTPAITMTGPDRRPTDRPQHWLAASSAPWLMIAATVMGVVGGLALDRWLDCTPWGVLGCSLAGIAIGIYMVIREGSR